MKPQKTWILIADGARARIVLNEGVGKGIKAIDKMIFQQESQEVRDIMADKPGRTFDSAGQGRHAMAYSSDPKRENERNFAKFLADILNKESNKGSFDRLVITAAPKTLGDIRDALSGTTQQKGHSEIAKDFTQLPNDDLVNKLKDVLAV